MSATTANPSPPASLIMRSVSLASPVGRWLTPTSAPSAAKRTAAAWPMPVVAPVTRATLPANRRSIFPSRCASIREHSCSRIGVVSGPAATARRRLLQEWYRRFPRSRRSGPCLERRSEHRNRIPGRTGRAGQTERQADDHELPALLLQAGLVDLFQL